MDKKPSDNRYPYSRNLVSLAIHSTQDRISQRTLYRQVGTPTDVRILSVHLVDGGLACSEDFHLHATCPCPLHRPGSHERPHRTGTCLLHHQPERRLARLGRQCHRCIVRHSVWWHAHPENAQESIARRTLRLRAPILPAKVYTDRYEDGNCSNDGHLLLPVR